MSIAPIETEYAGCRFRSRLEARWAVLFDDLGIRWEYEPQGYEFGGHRYLPDFRWPEQDILIEVKGTNTAMWTDLPRLHHFVRSGGTRALVLLGPIPEPDCTRSPGFITLRPYTGGVVYSIAMFCRIATWQLVHPIPVGTGTPQVVYDYDPVFAERLWVEPEYFSTGADQEFIRSCKHARSARFEFGETPVPKGE